MANQLEREQRIRGDWRPGGPAATGDQGQPDLLPGEGESLDRLSGDWRIFQLVRGHRYSTDDLLVAHHGCSLAQEEGLAVRRILDLGCGIGSVGMMAAWRFPAARLLGLEAQTTSVALARRSLRYNGIQERAEVREGDLREASLLTDQDPFDLVFGSPPYLPLGTGKVSDKPQCEPCRFELRGGVEEYCSTAARVLAPAGRVALIFTWRERSRVREAMARQGLRLLVHRAVITREGNPPFLSLFWGSLHRSGPAPADSREVEPLVVRQADGRHSPAMQALRQEMGFPPTRED